MFDAVTVPHRQHPWWGVRDGTSEASQAYETASRQERLKLDPPAEGAGYVSSPTGRQCHAW